MRVLTPFSAPAVHDVIDILSSDDDDDDCAPPPAKKAATTSATTQQTSVIRSNPKPAAESLLSQDPASYAGYEALISMCQSTMSNADPAFTNFIRELEKMRQYHRTQLEQQAAAQQQSQQQQHQSSSRSTRDSDNIITID
eukprot:sb/3474275/